MAFRLLALAVPDSVKTEITIAYAERNIMGSTLVVIVFSVNAGKVIKFRETNPMSNAGAVQGSAFPTTQVPTLRLPLFTVRISQYKQLASF